jgi:hypothetical protein
MDAVRLTKTLGAAGRVFGCMIFALASTRLGLALAGSSLDFAVIDIDLGGRFVVHLPDARPMQAAMRQHIGRLGVGAGIGMSETSTEAIGTV